MAESKLKLALKGIPKALANPGKAVELIWRRMFPFGIKPKDKEAYRIGSWSYGNAPRKRIAEIFPGIENSDVELINAFDKDPNTSMDFGEVVQLCAIAKHIKAKRITEIGTFDGNTALNLAANTNEDCKIFTVDLPTDWTGKMELKIPGIYENVTDRGGVGRQFVDNPKYHSKIHQVFCDSAVLDYSKLEGPMDLIFIDGNHHYEYVKKDTELALQNIRPGGVIVWHDYGMIKDVSEVTDNLSGINVQVVSGTRMAVAVIL